MYLGQLSVSIYKFSSQFYDNDFHQPCSEKLQSLVGSNFYSKYRIRFNTIIQNLLKRQRQFYYSLLLLSLY